MRQYFYSARSEDTAVSGIFEAPSATIALETLYDKLDKALINYEILAFNNVED